MLRAKDPAFIYKTGQFKTAEDDAPAQNGVRVPQTRRTPIRGVFQVFLTHPVIAVTDMVSAETLGSDAAQK